MTFAFVASDDGIDDASTTTLQSEFGFSVAVGQMIYADGSWESTDTPATMTDLIGNTYESLGKVKSVTNDQWVEQFYCRSSIGSNAANKCTLTLGAAATFKFINCLSASHDGTAIFDKVTTQEQAASTTISKSLTPAGPGSGLLITSTKAYNGGTWSQFDVTWTAIPHLDDRLSQASYKIVSGAAAVTGGGSSTTTTNLTMAYAAFKEVPANDGTYQLTSDLYF